MEKFSSFRPRHQLPYCTWDLGVGVVAGVGERIVSFGQERGVLAEVGHIRVEADGKSCHCGKYGCLEAETGGWAMFDELGRPDIQSLDELRSAIISGDEEAVKVARQAAYTIGKHLCWPIQVWESKRLIITGPLLPVFSQVRSSFIEGMASIFSKEEIAALNPQANRDPERAMQVGAARLSKRIYIYPEL